MCWLGVVRRITVSFTLTFLYSVTFVLDDTCLRFPHMCVRLFKWIFSRRQKATHLLPPEIGFCSFQFAIGFRLLTLKGDFYQVPDCGYPFL